MVVINLKAPFVSVIATVLSTLAEIALLSFLYAVNNLYECRRLQNGRSVQVRRHLFRTRLISLLCLAAFFVLEVLFSFYCDPTDKIVLETHECITVSNSVIERGSSIDFLRAGDILSQCKTLDNGTITQYAGNFSRKTQQVECSDTAMYTHVISGEVTEVSVADAPFGCAPGREGDTCVFVQQRGNVSLVSSPFLRIDLDFRPETWPHISTELHFEPPSNVSVFSDRALGAFEQFIQNPASLRRIIYSGARETNCTFPVVRGDATTVPLAMIIALAAVWVVAFLIFFSVFWLRKSVFFKMDDPMAWALRSVRAADDPLGENPVVTALMDNEKTLVKVSTLST